MVKPSRVFAALSLAVCCASAARAQTVSLPTLMEEMVDRGAIARVPAPWYTCRQASSYDRNSTSPEDTETWFANGDLDKFLGVEDAGVRREWVMMDEQGPGAIVRIWSANPPEEATLRIYLDGNPVPAIEAPMQDLLSGLWAPEGVTIGQPLAGVRSRGWNLYLPIPYASHCKITSDEPGFYYQVNYRTYDQGTEVEPFTAGSLKRSAALLARVQERLGSPWTAVTASMKDLTIPPGGHVTVDLPSSPHAVREIMAQIPTDAPRDALRWIVLEGAFDGEPTIWCPLGDFFLSGPLLNRVDTWVSRVEPSARTLRAGWIMPYENSGQLTLTNVGTDAVTLKFGVSTEPWKWDERSMHLHARWRQEGPMRTRPMRDWNYVEARGVGTYVGDALSVANPVTDWWGEGDEKIYVDGETFPSHFGTGTEDYYGYAWCCPEVFQGPFHAQPRCDGPGNYGHTTVARVRLLDGIPFRQSIKTDMEIWHWAECDIAYAVTSFLYMLPGGETNRPPLPDEASRGVVDPAPLPPPFRIEGALECEDLEIVAQSEGTLVDPQDMLGFGRDKWSGNTHLWVRARGPGEFVELAVPASGPGPAKLTIFATRSWDYGVVQFSVNGETAGPPIDCFSGARDRCEPTGPIELGTFTPIDGRFVIRAEVVGANVARVGEVAYFAIDAVLLEEGAQ